MTSIDVSSIRMLTISRGCIALDQFNNKLAASAEHSENRKLQATWLLMIQAIVPLTKGKRSLIQQK